MDNVYGNNGDWYSTQIKISDRNITSAWFYCKGWMERVGTVWITDVQVVSAVELKVRKFSLVGLLIRTNKNEWQDWKE